MRGIGAWEHALGAYYHGSVAAIPGVTVHGPDFSPASGQRAPTVSITIDGVTPQDAARALGDRGLQVWDGHFYAARAIEVLGLSDRGGVIRTGVVMYNTREEIDRLLAGVAELAKRAS